MNIIITAGGTYEKIDSVRKITNSSSGKLGKIIAEAFLNSNLQIDNLYYICTKYTLKPPHKKVKIILVESANDLLEATTKLLTTHNIDVFIHSMAVSDYTVDYITNLNLLSDYIKHNTNTLQTFEKNKKISSNEKDLIIKFKPTPKIIKQIKKISPNTYLVGFKLLNNVTAQNLQQVGFDLLTKNNCNLVVANDLKNININNHKALLIDREKNIMKANTKISIAEKLLQKIKEHYNLKRKKI